LRPTAVTSGMWVPTSNGSRPFELRRVSRPNDCAPCSTHHDTELAVLLHRGEHVARAQQHLHDLLKGLLLECVNVGHVRDDVAPDELASFCLHALAAATTLRSKAAVRRLVAVTLAGLQPEAKALRPGR
jgi:hypothetical protein